MGQARGHCPGMGQGSQPTVQNRMVKHNKRRKMSLAETLALNKRGKQDGNMQPCRSQRAQVTLKADSKMGGNQVGM